MIRLRSTLPVILACVLAGHPSDAAGQAAPAPRPAAALQVPPHATGDAWLDGRLADVDDYANRYPEAFAAELERYAGVPRAYVRGLLAQPGWGGGDAWFACFLAQATGASCRDIVRARTAAGAEAGWRQVAVASGAGPGSVAHADLRIALADSYRRWARPLQPDDALAEALRQRGQDHDGDPQRTP